MVTRLDGWNHLISILERCQMGSIFELQAFWAGYIYAMNELEHPIPDTSDFSEFHEWLQERLDAKTNLSWASILLFRSSDERGALDLFFSLLDEFINRNQLANECDEDEIDDEVESLEENV